VYWVAAYTAFGPHLALILEADRTAPGYHEGFDFWIVIHRLNPILFRAQTTPTAMGDTTMMISVTVIIASSILISSELAGFAPACVIAVGYSVAGSVSW
jgi:hypothetical protein